MPKVDKQEDFIKIAAIIQEVQIDAYNEIIKRIVELYGEDMRVAADWLADDSMVMETPNLIIIESIVGRAR